MGRSKQKQPRSSRQAKTGARELETIGMAFAPAAAPSDKKSVSFLDLPPEIRNIIYQLVFKYDEPVMVGALYLSIDHPLFGADEKTATQLLRVCRQVNGEAIPIFYGSNVFDVWDDRTFYDFINQIGSSAKHLRYLKLTHITNQSRLRSALHRLKQAKAFETFEWRTMGGLTRLLKHFVPWLRTLRKMRQAGGRTFDALDVLRVTTREANGLDRILTWGNMVDESAFRTFKASFASAKDA